VPHRADVDVRSRQVCSRVRKDCGKVTLSTSRLDKSMRLNGSSFCRRMGSRKGRAGEPATSWIPSWAARTT
jgi:hypothetical protein